MKILVAAFDSFGGEKINPALEAVKLLADEIAGAEIVKLEIPTVFHKSAETLREKALEVKPDMILCVGQAGGRFAITPERVAINQDDARIPDNEDNQPIDVSIQEDGAPAYFATLPIKAMVEKIKAAGVPAAVSNSAGTFVCNHIMYQALYLAEKELDNIQAGFIHVPFIPEQVVDKPEKPAMSLEDIAKGLTAALEAMVEYHGKEDIKKIGGTTH
ncbi:Pyrrolidone-carboxylate peptidase [Jeotgalibaca dankookensis]|uniref:Pyrrolidone-carboxylate peptidase n=1 Tax=Jeotgalibaca dankookensis TaxID=708126 RepID=A0A1S6IME1_9LACT|nr:pyroglutamyl-peptidase I [Jeotgalibaca dankookensis]AQS52705.1 Pyrrolidone-carboxylate peptidase [Jeotgalibaca dankookensis]